MNIKQKALWHIAADINTSPKKLTELSYSEDSHLLRLVAEHPNTPAEALIRLAGNISPYVRYGVTRNINAPTEALTILGTDSDYYILKNVSLHKNTSSDTLILIINNKLLRPNMAMYAASNAALSSSVIVEMLPGATLSVKRGFAVNVNTPTYVLCKYALDPSPFLRYSLALRTEFPEPLIEILKLDSDVDVQKALIENEFTPDVLIEYLLEHVSSGLVELIALRPNLAQVAKCKILIGDNRFAKVNLLNTFQLTTNEVSVLAKDVSHFVRMEVPKQLNVTEEILVALKNDPSIQVLIAVINSAKVSASLLKELSFHPDSRVRRTVACSAHLTNNLSYNLSEDTSHHVRIALIRNPKVTLDAVADLAYDENKDVSRIARQLLTDEFVVNSKYEHMAY